MDNLSHGRVGISIASGWHPNDFIFAPDRFERRREICLEDLQTIQKLWRGESLPMRAGAGSDFDVRLFPLPVQKQLPVWLTCIHEESFVRAGENRRGRARLPDESDGGRVGGEDRQVSASTGRERA